MRITHVLQIPGEWKRPEQSITAVADSGEVFLSSSMLGIDSMDAFLRCTYDGVPVLSRGNLTLVPAGWASREFPSLSELLDEMQQSARRAAVVLPCALPAGHCVYVVSDGDGFCKIGKAVDVSKRIRQLQTGNARKLYVSTLLMCGSEFDSSQAERAAHAILREHRSSGEWFRVSERIAEQTLYEAAAEVGIKQEVLQIEFREEVQQ